MFCLGFAVYFEITLKSDDMLSFVKSIGTGQGQLIFYFNELPSAIILVSVVDRKNKTHLFHYHETSASWKAHYAFESASFWSGDLQASLQAEIQKERRTAQSPEHISHSTGSLSSAA